MSMTKMILYLYVCWAHTFSLCGSKEASSSCRGSHGQDHTFLHRAAVIVEDLQAEAVLAPLLVGTAHDWIPSYINALPSLVRYLNL